MALRLEDVDQLTQQQADDVLALRDAISAHDGSSPLSDHVVVGLRHRATGVHHVLAWSDTELVGYGHVEPPGTAELLVAPHNDAGPIIDKVSSLAGPALTVWARGDHSPLAAELPRRGFAVSRVLLQMRRSLEDPVPKPVWPAGVKVRTFVTGQDEDAWLAVNNAAFADHPEQSGWTVDDIVARQQEPWFDPNGFFLAERDDDLVGFHWTKIHPTSAARREAIGEVYVIGVAPVMQGQRLGEALTVHGMAYLKDRRLPAVMLYVDESNQGAVALYEKLGFDRWDADRCFTRS